MKTIGLILLSLFCQQLLAQNNTELKLGDTAPEISLPDTEGNQISLSKQEGKLILIDFWATWCAPCIKEQPLLKELYQSFHDQGFNIYGVSLDRNKENWVNGINRLELNWPQVSDLKFWMSPVAGEYGIRELPFNILIDDQRKIVAINLHEEELSDFVKEFFSSDDE